MGCGENAARHNGVGNILWRWRSSEFFSLFTVMETLRVSERLPGSEPGREVWEDKSRDSTGKGPEWKSSCLGSVRRGMQRTRTRCEDRG